MLVGLPSPYAHQTRSLHALRVAYHQGARSVCVVLPTGGGKTLLGTMVMDGGLRKGRRGLWLAHTDELVQQGYDNLAKLGVPVGFIKSGRASNPSAPIQVASVQTLTARPQDLPPADIIIPDECHHVAAETWTALLGRYRSPELICGFTATPVRADGKPLGRASGGVFDAMVAKTSVVDLQTQLRPDGHPILVQCEVVGPGPDAPRNVLFRPPLAGLREFGRDAQGRIRPTIMFVSSVKEARDVAAQANAINIRAAAIDGTMSDAKREDAIRRYAQGELDLLTNVFVLTEGFDAPRTEVIALARQCQALSTFIQIIGRGLRSSPATGKKDCLLIDYCGMSYNHGLIETPRAYSLEGRGIATSADDLKVRQCPHCGGVDIPKPVCRRCGASLAMPRPKAKVEVSNAQRIEENQLDSPSKKRAVFDGLCARARANGYAKGWIGKMFQIRYGHWPAWALPDTKKSSGARA